ncbi:MAG TPA: hypothetical protein VMG41_05400 [Gemmatimonadales bacterium]|nr:hypothetical protein [Gemmatimonadales bacterium]
MSSSQLVGQGVRTSGPVRPEVMTAWGLLSAAGLAFTIVALADLTLTWLPMRFGDGNWEFDTVSAILSGLPLLAVGMVLGYAAALTRRRHAAARAWSVLMLIASVLLIAAFALYLTEVPGALAAATAGRIHTELMKAVIKTMFQGVTYPVLFLWLGLRGLSEAAHS